MSKKQLPQGKGSRRVFSEEFKREAVQMLLDGHSASSVCERLGLAGTNMLYWDAPSFCTTSYESTVWETGNEQSSAVCCWSEGSAATEAEAAHCDANWDGVR